MGYGICPNCDNKVMFEKEPVIGVHVLCETCQTELVISWLNPIELAIIEYEDYEPDDGSRKYDEYDDFDDYLTDEEYADESEVEIYQNIRKNKRGGYNGKEQYQKK